MVATAESRRLPENGLVRVIEAGRCDTHNGQRISVDSDRSSQDFRIASKKLLPDSVTDHCHCVSPRQSPTRSIHILISSESTAEHRLYTQYREEIPRCLGDVSPAPDAHSTKVHIVFLKQRGIGEICTLLPPVVKLFCAIVRWNELMENCQAVWLRKWKGALAIDSFPR